MNDLIQGPSEYILCGNEPLVPLATVASVPPPQPDSNRKRKQQRTKKAKKEQVIVMSDSDSSPEINEKPRTRPIPQPRKPMDKPQQNGKHKDDVDNERMDEPPAKKGFVLKSMCT